MNEMVKNCSVTRILERKNVIINTRVQGTRDNKTNFMSAV